MANDIHVEVVREGAGAVRRWREQHRSEWLDLTDENLAGANLLGANLIGANLVNTDFNGCLLYSTILAAVDLSTATNLATAEHASGSEVSFNTLSQTLRGCGGIFTPELLDFFELAGIPRTLLDYLPSILGTDPLKFYSCFIRYETADEQFASGLEQELSNAGVKTWKWDMKAVLGRDLRENIDRASTILTS